METINDWELEKKKELVQEILRATNEERIRWLPTARLNEYTGSFNGRWSVVVGRFPMEENLPDEETYVRVDDNRGHIVLRLTDKEVLRSSGASPMGPVERIAEFTNNPVNKLYEAVTHSASYSEKGVEEFLRDLKRA